jgi:hypothetical protein
MTLELEFTVEPFEPGRPGPHVRAAEETACTLVGEARVGPFGTAVSGPDEKVLTSLASVVRAAVSAGASRVTLQVSARGARSGYGPTERDNGELRRGKAARSDFVEAVLPVVEALGGEVVSAGDARPMDVSLVWNGAVVAAVRPPALHGAFGRLLSQVASELGAPLAELSREQKQRAVELLEERGAFAFRKSVEEAAQALEVSRFTVYNYLSRIPDKREPTAGRRSAGSV